jgi:uncharacterized membrane protein YkoI
MKTSTTIALTVALMSVLGFSAVLKTVNASPYQNSLRVAEASDGDGELNDATEPPENTQLHHHFMQMITTNNSHHTTIVHRSDNDGEANDDRQSQQEQAKLQSLAKITPQQAQQAAETYVGNGAKARRVKLENENGNLVYAVEIGQQEVKVDAGNGKVLYSENVARENDENEASRPHSSIQVPQNNNEQ